MTAISFSNALGVHERALLLRTERATVLANNLANADTPGFKARDFDFAAALRGATAEPGLQIQRTNARHLGADTPAVISTDLQYRVPLQPSIDGNTVDSQLETAAFARNAMDFAASFRLLNSRLNGLSKALGTNSQ